MAILHVHFLSQALKRTVPFVVVLPSDKVTSYGCPQREKRPFKTLYLLHGLMGDCNDWTLNTNIQRMAEDRNLAVVMLSGENSFYVDGRTPNSNFGEYIGRELVDVTRNMFPLSHRRENTFIAGFSMGGFGAIRNGLRYYNTFGRIAVLSGALQIFEVPPEQVPGWSLFGEHDVFGDIALAAETDKNPRAAFNLMKAATNGEYGFWPKIYIACGEQDALLPVNRSLCDFLRQEGMDVTWAQTPGGHSWDFWRAQLKEVLDWLPLDAPSVGINSGNVRTV